MKLALRHRSCAKTGRVHNCARPVAAENLTSHTPRGHTNQSSLLPATTSYVSAGGNPEKAWTYLQRACPGDSQERMSTMSWKKRSTEQSAN